MKVFLGFFAITLISFWVVALVALPPKADNDTLTPLIQTVNPDAAKPGSLVTAEGAAIRNNTDFKLEIISRRTDGNVARLPRDLEAGKYRLMVLPASATPRFIEQPVMLTVE